MNETNKRRWSEEITHTQVSQTQSIVNQSKQIESMSWSLTCGFRILALQVGGTECRSNDLHSVPPTSLSYRVKSEIKHRVNLTFYMITQIQRKFWCDFLFDQLWWNQLHFFFWNNLNYPVILKNFSSYLNLSDAYEHNPRKWTKCDYHVRLD